MNRQEYNHKELTGVDVDVEISLKEYGIAWIETEDECLFYYGIQYDGQSWYMFDFCSFPKTFDIKKEFDWMDEEDWKRINSFIGMDIEDEHFPGQIFALVSYYGTENIFGSSYYEGLTYEEVIAGKTEE